jgi:hypothetical protein
MATKQVNGSAVTASSTKNNGGVGKHVGTATTLTNRGFFAGEKTVFASTVVDNSQVDESVSAGTLAFDSPRGVIRRVNTTIGGISNTILQAGAAVPSQRDAIHQTSGIIVSDLTTAIRDGRWNAFSGAFSPVLSGLDPDFGNDNAANPSRATPGEFAYRDGSPLAIQDEYSAKNT